MFKCEQCPSTFTRKDNFVDGRLIGRISKKIDFTFYTSKKAGKNNTSFDKIISYHYLISMRL